MKTIKMACVTVLALLTVAAFTGASPVMAESTALCDQTPEGGFDFPGGTYLTGEACLEKHRVTHVHETTLEGAKAKLLTSILNVECDVLFLGDTALTEKWESISLASPLVLEGNFTYSNCGNCTVEEVGIGTEIRVLKSGHETAKVTGEGEVHVKCTGLNCTYNGEGLLGTAKGWWLSGGVYPNGSVSIWEQTVKKVSGLFCPSTSKLDITTTSLSRMFIGS